MTFELHRQLAADTLPVAELKLCRVLLMNDARYPWTILVPRREGLRDFHDVAAGDKAAFVAEIDEVSAVLKGLTGAQKMNVAALGNMVPQLHVHVIARFEGDAAWPKPVWGLGEARPYAPDKAGVLIEKLKKGLLG
ncbi:MAG: HIT domain-containing protein [Parvibaculum sp.]|uniref:HIT domain-containing protein n=1 Tax=Parvibaculum sp. TaxID=2024848 RepID=UPI00284756A4|nr:HIT domain-containing protein [Parvibaculum sp.]MDR3499284.1 HIT domain-containing protein [Parvibaculum sp.]